MKKISLVILFIFLILVNFTGCTSKKEDITYYDMNKNNSIKLAGSTSVSPLIKKLKEDYEKNNKIKIEIQENGSSSGILSAIEGISDIAMSSRDLTEKEKNDGLEEIKFALDGIVVVVNKENKVNNLSVEDVKKIFLGEIKNWNQLGGDDGEIIVISRENGSGTKTAFEELTKLQKQVVKDGKVLIASMISKNALFENNTGAIKSNIKTSKNAIGYISLGTLDDNLKPISINGIYCSEESVKNGSYIIARPFILAFKNENLNDQTNKFLKYIMSDEGQNIIEKNGYISVH